MKKYVLFWMALLSITSVFAQNFTDSPGLTAMDATSGTGWTGPVGALFSKDGNKLFVWEKRGRVYVCNRNAGTGLYVKQETPLIDISPEVGDWRDFGLLGFAIDPQFVSNGRIYLYYVVDRHYLMKKDHGQGTYSESTNEHYAATIGRVTRYETTTSNGNIIAATATRKVLLGETKSTGVPILHESHGTGGLVFAADGTLLLSSGDGASYNTMDGGNISHTYYIQGLADGIIRPEENVGAFRSQMLNSHSGKLLRIDPETGNGIGSNPFYDEANPRSAKSRVWALGLRNPFRISVRPGSGSTNPSTGDIGEVFIGDVGWGTWEELNIAKAPGMNFGWPIYEGQTIMGSYNDANVMNQDEPNPLYNAGACGRQFYRFKELIKQDNGSKNSKVFNPCNSSLLIGENNRFIHARPAIDWRHGQDIARVPRFAANGDATEPTVGSAASGVTGPAFRGNSSSGGTWFSNATNNFPAEYTNTFIVGDYNDRWIRRLGIGFTDVVTKVSPLATNAGAVVCLVENPLDGNIYYINYSTVRKITFGGNMPPVARIIADTTYAPSSSLRVSFTGNTSYDPTPGGSVRSYSWNFGGIGGSGNSNTSTQANPTRTFSTTPGTPKKFVVKLTVSDNQGASHTDSVVISVSNTPPVIQIMSPIKESTYEVGLDSTYKLEAQVTDLQHSGAQLSYAWQTTLRHNDHEHPETVNPAVSPESVISRIGCNGDNYYWMVSLKVTDAAGLSASDSSKIFPDCAGTLPLFLHKFSVNPQTSGNVIKWVTQLESNMEYFEVERSTDGMRFFAINQQPCRNTAGTNEYTYTDRSAPSGAVYYRLKMVEHGAVIRYSMVIKLMQDQTDNGVLISPNPVVDNFSVSFTSKANTAALITIRDAAGATVYRAREAVTRGNNVVYLQNKAEWRSGIYFVTIDMDGQVLQGKFIKADK